NAVEQAIWERNRQGAVLEGLIHHSDRGVQGGFNWWSQHLEDGGVVGWLASRSGWRRFGRCAASSGRRVGRRLRGGRIGFGSGRGSLEGCRPRTLLVRRGCRRRLGRGGSAMLVGCHRLIWVGPLPVVLRAGGNRHPPREGGGCARDRPSAWS